MEVKEPDSKGIQYARTYFREAVDLLCANLPC